MSDVLLGTPFLCAHICAVAERIREAEDFGCDWDEMHEDVDDLLASVLELRKRAALEGERK